ncbi:hypothetical protein [Pseudomonas alkylphenolica]|uniref:hypothetical protein n=1 Tax=Pseudomonas alkylphenolica TaxID=237609 RepID=UPI000F9DD729
MHACILLKSAYHINAHACDMVNVEARGLLWVTEQSLEMSMALVEAVQDEVEARSATLAVLRRAAQADRASVKE